MTSSDFPPRILILLGAFSAMLAAPAPLLALAWQAEGLVPQTMSGMLQPLSSPSSADLDLDAGLESFSLTQGVVGIYRDGERLWTSPAEWDVAQAQVSDLNHDGQAELALLVWRKYAAWPVDAYMAYPGRIRDFHDQDGLSCHFILIGWRHGAFRELWAGSALARPLLAFRALDVNGDGRQELLVLESHYDAQQRIADSVALWEWNGFGFSLLTRTPQRVYPSIVAARSPDGEVHILLQTRSWR